MTDKIIDLENNLKKRIPQNFSEMTDRPPSIAIEKIIKQKDDIELVLFELPKGFDKALLNKIKIRNFGENGKISKLTGDYQGICFNSSNPIPRQTLGIFETKDRKSFRFKAMDKYVKVFEHIDLPHPTPENVIPRRLIIKKAIGKRKKNDK